MRFEHGRGEHVVTTWQVPIIKMENKSESLDDNNMADSVGQPKNGGQDDDCSLENDPELNELLDCMSIIYNIYYIIYAH